MPAHKLPQEVRDEIHRLKAANPALSCFAISQQLGCSSGIVSQVLRTQKPSDADRIDKYAAFHQKTFLELHERFQKWVGDTGRTSSPKRKPSKRKRVLAINDVHTPFHNEEALAQTLSDNKDADECWVVGDLFDLFSFSRYEKSRVTFSAVEEFQHGRSLVRTLSERFPVVRVMHGNHDDRFIKYLQRANIPAEILEYFRMLDPNYLSPLAKICSDFKNIVMMEPKEIDFARYPFLHQIGDCVLSHAERYSKIPGKTPADVLEVLQKKLLPMGVVDDFKVLCQAHTHAAGKVWGDYGVVTIEMGCLARTPDYDGNARLMGRKPIIGYTVIEQENGITDINKSNFIQLG